MIIPDEIMSTIATHSEKLITHEKMFTEIKYDIKEIKDLCIKMDKNLDFNKNKVDEHEKRIEKVEKTTEYLKVKIIGWSVAIGVVLWLITHDAINFKNIINSDKHSSSWGSNSITFADTMLSGFTSNITNSITFANTNQMSNYAHGK
jgi:hypothetical protein